MSKNLLIVESPAKAKTIEKILGKDFTVKSSFGHVRDLTKKGVDVENNFQPTYEVSPDKTKVVNDLKATMAKVDEVWLATDEDREGEAISWHLCEVLGLSPKTTKRIVFREITAPAITSAIQNPRTVDMDVVDAQQARRILDRLVGFELSALLWKKVKNGLSAGRVQSVTVKLVVEREREIQEFESQAYFKVVALFAVKDKNGRMSELSAILPQRFDTPQEAESFLEKCKGADFSIENITKRPLKRKPTAPFTTSTLQQEASRKLGFGVKRTMSNAQRLYEQGFITYMRTDSVMLSETALTAMATEIEAKYGQEYVETRRYKNKKNGNAQEAHEAIRPSYIDKTFVTTDRDQQRLYELIWKRAIASQMSEALLEKTTVDIGISTLPAEKLKAEGEVLKFDGFLKVYLESKDDDDDEDDTKGILPPLKVGQKLDLDTLTATERFTRGPARFTEAGLVKKLEELGIGRPSTYAPTISKIMEESRGYVTKESREGVERKYQVMVLAKDVLAKTTSVEITGTTSNRLYPSDMGIVVTDFLDNHFKGIMDYSFTAKVENELDEVAEGKEVWTKMLGDFYHPFHEKVEDKVENADRASGERILGIDPETGRSILVRLTRYGVVAQIGKPEELEEDEKPKYANLRRGMSLELVTLEEVMPLFQLPKDLGTYEDLPVSVAIGRFGPYVKFGEAFISLEKGEEPLDVTFERAVELIEAKKAADAPIHVYDGKPVQKGAGRFGPFLKWNELFINIPARYDAENISKEDMDILIAAKVEKEANRYIHHWPELKLSVENARWGPIIKWNKKKINIPKIDDKRATPEYAAEMTLEQVKELVEVAFPKAFEVKKKATRKKAAPKKKAATKK